jgi:hypothetical protein
VASSGNQSRAREANCFPGPAAPNSIGQLCPRAVVTVCAPPGNPSAALAAGSANSDFPVRKTPAFDLTGLCLRWPGKCGRNGLNCPIQKTGARDWSSRRRPVFRCAVEDRFQTFHRSAGSADGENFLPARARPVRHQIQHDRKGASLTLRVILALMDLSYLIFSQVCRSRERTTSARACCAREASPGCDGRARPAARTRGPRRPQPPARWQFFLFSFVCLQSVVLFSPRSRAVMAQLVRHPARARPTQCDEWAGNCDERAMRRGT